MFFAVSLVAAVTPLLPFTFHTSPLDVWTELASDPFTPDREVVQLATPFFVALLMAAWCLRRVIRPALRRGERLAMYAIGLSGVSLTGAFVGHGLAAGALKPMELAQVMIAPAVVILGLGIAMLLLRRRYRDDAAAVVLSTGYVANAAMVLVALYSPDHSGWWVTLVAVIGIGGEWVYLLVRSVRAAF